MNSQRHLPLWSLRSAALLLLYALLQLMLREATAVTVRTPEDIAQAFQEPLSLHYLDVASDVGRCATALVSLSILMNRNTVSLLIIEAVHTSD
jgi:hypothetical protein